MGTVTITIGSYGHCPPNCTANLAYGNAGWQGVVDPGETLIYNLKLIEVIKPQ